MFKGYRKWLIVALSLAIIPVFCISHDSGTVCANADGVAEIAMELNTGKIFHSKNADKMLPMASTTKIMTALIVCEECDLSQVVTVPDAAVGVEGSSIYLKKGETLTVADLLYGLMLRSGNDAACALAIIHSGSVDKFVEKMNARAAELGAESTHFKNPSGLPDEEHYTTAEDLCNIARHAMKNETFKEVVGTKVYKGDYRQFANKNKLLNRLEGANGVKTGYTERAGRCLVSSAQRGNMDVVCVVLNCYDMFERSSAIINACFDRYTVEKLSADTVYYYKGKACKLDGDYNLVLEKGQEVVYEIEDNPASSQLDAIATLKIYCKNNLIFSHNLYTIK